MQDAFTNNVPVSSVFCNVLLTQPSGAPALGVTTLCRPDSSGNTLIGSYSGIIAAAYSLIVSIGETQTGILQQLANFAPVLYPAAIDPAHSTVPQLAGTVVNVSVGAIIGPFSIVTKDLFGNIALADCSIFSVRQPAFHYWSFHLSNEVYSPYPACTLHSMLSTIYLVQCILFCKFSLQSLIKQGWWFSCQPLNGNTRENTMDRLLFDMARNNVFLNVSVVCRRVYL